MTEQDYDPEFTGVPMWDQLGKILDSQGNPVERNWVVTDDGVKFENITPRRASLMRDAILQIAKPAVRLSMIKGIQTSEGFRRLYEMVK